MPIHNRLFYLDTINRYFTAMDTFDVDGVMACFASGGSLTCVSDGEVYSGESLRQFFKDITENSNRMEHKPTNFVIDVEAGTCACELDYFDDMKDNRVYDMHNCNFFEFDADGKFTHVRFWMGNR